MNLKLSITTRIFSRSDAVKWLNDHRDSEIVDIAVWNGASAAKEAKFAITYKSKVAFNCACCGKPIYDGEEYYNFLFGKYCNKCVEDVLTTADEESEDDF